MHVTFVDLDANLTVATDPKRWEGQDAEPMPGVDPEDLGNGHAVILMSGKLVDLTFGQFDPSGKVPRLLAVNLASPWRGELEWTAPNGRWRVRFEDMTDDSVLRRNERDLPTVNEGLVERLHDEAVAHLGRNPLRGARVGRNDPCPCGSGKKSKFCKH